MLATTKPPHAFDDPITVVITLPRLSPYALPLALTSRTPSRTGSLSPGLIPRRLVVFIAVPRASNIVTETLVYIAIGHQGHYVRACLVIKTILILNAVNLT